MHETIARIILLGRGDFFEATRRHAQQHSRLSFSDLAMALLVFAGLAVLLYFLSRMFSPSEKSRGVNSPLRLFWDLCRIHRLKLSQRWLLWRISNEYGLKDPALVFIEPELFDTEVMGAGFAGNVAAIESLHKLLFDDLGADDT